MYRLYKEILGSFQGDFKIFLKKWYILVKFYISLRLISWSLPDDQGGITCMLYSNEHLFYKFIETINL